MKKLTLITTIICLLVISGNAQSVRKQVFGSAGDTDSIAGYQVNWTIGECITEKLTGTNFIVTQGFQQPYFTITAIPETTEIDFSLYVFPNPTRDYLNIEIINDTPEKFLLILSSMKGEILSEAVIISGEPYRMDLTSFGSNLMFLKIINNSSKQTSTLKIIKTY
jgi:hypothetical protein